jgi:hypothetical protein
MTQHRPAGPEPVTEPADPWPHSPYPQLELALGGGRRRRPRWWWRVGGAAVTAVLAVTAFLVALSWPAAEPAGTAIPFRPLAEVRQVDFAEPTDNTFSRVVGDRAYLAWQQGDDLELAGFDLAAGGEELWRSRIAGAAEQWWGELIATPTAVVALGYPYEPDDPEREEPQPRPMVVLDAATGGERHRWGRDVYPYDEVWVVGETLVLADRAAGALRGLRLDTGVHRWVEPFRGRPGAAMAVVPVLGAELLAAPSTWWGAPAAATVDQVVMVGEDRTARLVDLVTGEVVAAAGTNVAGPDDLLLAYQGRLYVAGGEEGYQLQVRDLAELAAQPEHLYTAPDPDRRLEAMVPCAAELLCLLDRHPSYHRDAEVRVLDISAGRGRDPQRWARAVPRAEWLVPAGDWLLVGGGNPVVAGYNHAGDPVFDLPEGAAARIDADNLLLFSEQPDDGAQDLALAGLPIGAQPGRVELGQLAGVHGGRCSWNDTYLVCPGDEGAGIWRFRQ